MKKLKFLVTINQYLKESKNIFSFTENQYSNAQKLFQEVFDIYLRRVSSETYPMIYHCTRIENYNYIKNNGLISERNYFLEYDNDLNNYEDGEPGIACGVNYKDVIDRLYPDPEWAPFDIIQKTGNPDKFYEKNIDERVIYCLWITDILKLDITKELSINDITDEKMDFMVEENMFCWLYVKGKVSPDLITIEINPDLQ